MAAFVARILLLALAFPLVALSELAVGGGVSGIIEDAGGAWQYVLVFVLAATPWLEVVVVIPAGIGLDLNPIGVGVLAFLGNTLAVYAIVFFYSRVRSWWRARRGEPDGTDESGRSKRARRLWDRYGMAGLALASPLFTGIHLAAFIGLALGASNRSIAGWMTGSIALWTIVLTAGSVWGFSLLGIA